MSITLGLLRQWYSLIMIFNNGTKAFKGYSTHCGIIFHNILRQPLIWTQGSKSSDFSLISDFPTPRTILEISANLRRKKFRGVKELGWIRHFRFEKMSQSDGTDKPHSSLITQGSGSHIHSFERCWPVHYTLPCACVYALFRLFWQNPFWYLLKPLSILEWALLANVISTNQLAYLGADVSMLSCTCMFVMSGTVM